MPIKKVLITGGAGFIGYYLTKELVKRGVDVVIYDSFMNYIPPLESRYSAYLEYRLNDIKNDCYIVRGDIRNRGNVIRVLNETKPEAIIHLAAIPIATVSNQFSEEAIQINLNGTVTLLECIRAVSSVKKFIFASSSFVYGDFKYEPADENHETSPIDIYGGTKLSGEILTKSFGKRYDIDYTIIRPSAVYGPTDANRRVSQILVENAFLGKPLIMHNNGNDRVDFTYVEDTAQGFALAVLNDDCRHKTFNITCGKGRSIREFIDILRNYFPDLTVKELPADERRPDRGGLDITKAENELGYQPANNLEKGIAKYVEFIKTTNVLKK